MRRWIFAGALASVVIGQGAAQADPVWAGAGWYQVAYTPNGRALWAGPFADSGACAATLPASDDYADYDCDHFDARPDWGY